MQRYARVAFALLVLVWMAACSITGGQDQPRLTSTSISNPTALTKGSPVYQISDLGDMELVRYFNDLGEEVSVTVEGIAKAGGNWVILHTSLEITLLVNVESGDAFDISGMVNPNYLYGVERGNYIYFGNANTGALYRFSTLSSSVSAVNDPEKHYIDFQQSENYPGFYVFNDDLVMAIVHDAGGFVVFGTGSSPQPVVPDPPDNFSINTALWSYFPKGNEPLIYGPDGHLYEVIDQYSNNVGVWSTTFKLRKFEYSASPTLVDDNGYGQSFDSYGTSVDTTFGTISDSATPTWILRSKNRPAWTTTERYFVSPAGYVHVTASGGALTATWHPRDLSAINASDLWIADNMAYWTDSSDNIVCMNVETGSSPASVVSEPVEKWGIADRHLVYNTVNHTKRVNLEDLAAGPEILSTPAVPITVFVEFRK